MKKFLIFALAFVFLFGSASVFAKEWPARPIEISCFASAGGGTDTTDRAIAKAMDITLDELALLIDTRKPKTNIQPNQDIEDNPKLLDFRLKYSTPNMRLWPMVSE